MACLYRLGLAGSGQSTVAVFINAIMGFQIRKTIQFFEQPKVAKLTSCSKDLRNSGTEPIKFPTL
jgi:hypothetical protein